MSSLSVEKAHSRLLPIPRWRSIGIIFRNSGKCADCVSTPPDVSFALTQVQRRAHSTLFFHRIEACWLRAFRSIPDSYFFQLKAVTSFASSERVYSLRHAMLMPPTGTFIRAKHRGTFLIYDLSPFVTKRSTCKRM